jgi:hypothetical protein
VVAEHLAPVAGKRVEALEWREADAASADERLAFDHGRLIAQAIGAAREEVEALELPLQLLPAQFTLGELQAVCGVRGGSGTPSRQIQFQAKTRGPGHAGTHRGRPSDGAVQAGAAVFQKASRVGSERSKAPIIGRMLFDNCVKVPEHSLMSMHR